MNLQQALAVAVDAAVEVGTVLMRYFRSSLQCSEKGTRDIVTDADLASERVLLDRIRSAFPNHQILSEEAGPCGAGSGPTWYIDPLDGTGNFSRGVPLFCVALAVAENAQVLAAVVHDPLHQETFSAARHLGAALNDHDRLCVSRTDALNRAILATGFPSPRRHQGASGQVLVDLAMGTHAIRRSGSSALDFAWLAAGRLDAVWDQGLGTWDVAAGSLLVEEAGGSVTDCSGRAWRPGCSDVVATNGLVHQELMALLAGISKAHCTG